MIVTNNGDSLNCKITEVKNEEVYARTNRMGVYLYPQFNFFNKKTPNHPQYNNIKGNGLTYDGGIYFEKIFGNVGLSAGVGYMQLNSTHTYTLAKTDTDKKAIKMDFISIHFGGVYEHPVKDNISIGVRGGFRFNYLVIEKQIISGVESTIKLSDYESILRLHYQFFGGPSATFLFNDKVGLSIVLPISTFSGPDLGGITYLSIGGQIQLFYAFGKTVNLKKV